MLQKCGLLSGANPQVLIVGPLTVIQNWQVEFDKAFTDPSTEECHKPFKICFIYSDDRKERTRQLAFLEENNVRNIQKSLDKCAKVFG